MKRSWLGAALLALLLILGVLSQWGSSRINTPAREALEKAAHAAQKEDWAQVDRHIKEARDHWQKHKDLRAAVVDHSHIEMIECSFAGLEVQRASRDAMATAVTCADLSRQMQALEDTQKLSWENVL